MLLLPVAFIATSTCQIVSIYPQHVCPSFASHLLPLSSHAVYCSRLYLCNFHQSGSSWWLWNSKASQYIVVLLLIEIVMADPHATFRPVCNLPPCLDHACCSTTTARPRTSKYRFCPAMGSYWLCSLLLWWLSCSMCTSQFTTNYSLTTGLSR